MKKLFWLFLLAPVLALGQIHTFPALDTNNTFTGANTFAAVCKLGNERYVDSVNSCGWSGGTVANQIITACNDATASGTVSGTVHIQPGTGSGLPALGALPTGCSLEDRRGLAGGGGVGFYRSLLSGGTYEAQTAIYGFMYNCPDSINCRVLQADATGVVGTSAGSNIAAIVGLCSVNASACVDGTNYGGASSTFAGTATCTGTACVGTGTNWGTGNNLAKGDWIAPAGQRTIACARQVSAVTDITHLTIETNFGVAGPGGLVCPTGVNPAGITLVLLQSSPAVHGEGIQAATEGVIGANSGVGPGNIYRPAYALRGACGPVANYCIGLMAFSPQGPAAQFTKGTNGSQVYVDPATNKQVVDINNTTDAVSASGEETLRLLAAAAFGTLGSGPRMSFWDSAETTELAEFGTAAAGGTAIDFIIRPYNGGLQPSNTFRVLGAQAAVEFGGVAATITGKTDGAVCGANTSNILQCSYNNDTASTVARLGATSTWTAEQTFNSGISNAGTGFKHVRSAITCTTGATIGSICTTGAISWSGSAFADTNYTLTCTLSGSVTNVPTIVSTARSAASFTVTIAALTAAAASYSEVDCTAVHD